MMTQAILTRPLLIAAVVGLLTITFGVTLPSLEVDNTPEVWLPSDLASLEELAEFRRRFGDDSLILAFTSGPAATDPARQPDWEELIAGLRAVPGVETALAPGFAETEEGPHHPLRFYLTSEDSQYAAVALFPKSGLNHEQRGRLVERLDEYFSQWRERLGRFRLAGADVITYELDRGSQQSLGGLSPLVFAAMCLVLLIATREWRMVAVGLLAIIAVNVWSLGLVAVASRPMNLVLAVMPAILAVVVIAQAMHLFSRFQKLNADVVGGAPGRATRIGWWGEAMRATWRPCFLCTVTTAAGFASLGTSEIAPVRDLGLFTAAGVLFSFAVCFTFLPALLATSSKTRPVVATRRPWWTPDRASRLAGWLRRQSRWIAAAGLVVAVVACFGLSRLRLESHILTFFPESHRVPSNYHAMEDHLMGLSQLEFVVQGSRDRMTSDETLTAYRDLLAESIAEEPLLREVVSVLIEPTRAGNLEFVLEPQELREALEEEGIPEGLERFLQVDGDRYILRTTLLATTSSSNAVHALVERLRLRIAARLPSELEAAITGSAALLIQGQVLLLETQVLSFGLALLAVTVVILMAFRSLRLALLSLLPNLLPVLFTLGLMGLAGIPLNTATVTVAGIALGLIVDDTIHFLHHWRTKRQAGEDAGVAAADTLYHVGRPALITTVTVAVGFGMFALAPFRPTLFFGLLIALTALTALLCDFVILPALLQMRAAIPAPDLGAPELGPTPSSRR